MTQNDAILEYLKAGHSLTPLEALNRFGCFRLGARCWDLRHKGHEIESKLITANGKTYACYWLKKPEYKADEAGQLAMGF